MGPISKHAQLLYPKKDHHWGWKNKLHSTILLILFHSTLAILLTYLSSLKIIPVMDVSISLLFTLCSCPFVHSFQNPSTHSLDSFLQDFALNSFSHHRPRTGALYRAILPANTSGMEVSLERLRSRRLWNRGANFSYFIIPPRTISVPQVRRLVFVYQNLGNWSSILYNIPGHLLVTTIISFVAFDASNISSNSTKKLRINTMGKPITIHFPDFKVPDRSLSKTKCAEFIEDGRVNLRKMSVPGVCYAANEGHFSVVLPLEKKMRIWWVWMLGSVLGIAVLFVVIYGGITSARGLEKKKNKVTERKADEDLILESRWIGSSKMPSAATTRTQPELEDVNF